MKMESNQSLQANASLVLCTDCLSKALGMFLEHVFQFSFFPEGFCACALQLQHNVRPSTVSGMVGTVAL